MIGWLLHLEEKLTAANPPLTIDAVIWCCSPLACRPRQKEAPMRFLMRFLRALVYWVTLSAFLVSLFITLSPVGPRYVWENGEGVWFCDGEIGYTSRHGALWYWKYLPNGGYYIETDDRLLGWTWGEAFAGTCALLPYWSQGIFGVWVGFIPMNPVAAILGLYHVPRALRSAWRALRNRRRRRLGRRIACGYDLHGNITGRCPECGFAIDTQQPRAAATLDK